MSPPRRLTSLACLAEDGDRGSGRRLAITLTSTGPTWTISLSGSLDTDSAIALETQFEQLQSGLFEEVVVDIGELCFLDHAGAMALERLGDCITDRGAQLHIRSQGLTLQ